ncbi:hypothetical protein F2Q70_00009627 [Brassica cretica]|uniref:Uncharacterized protein n=1 Tax=Brassica cretica TaxID=69181 RepID=A0A8S9M2Y5_BRACR|nr:hypothetical protein F2Q70_00009627 [Brassica cretica]
MNTCQSERHALLTIQLLRRLRSSPPVPPINQTPRLFSLPFLYTLSSSELALIKIRSFARQPPLDHLQ